MDRLGVGNRVCVGSHILDPGICNGITLLEGDYRLHPASEMLRKDDSHQQDRDMPTWKVLLLNASNKEDFPVYPYAFIQVPAIARRVGIDVVCKDLLGIPQGGWKQTILGLIELHDPVMILITLRNTDALVAREYKLDNPREGVESAYFPIERTRELITAIRTISDLKIAVGGFGFSLLPNELMHYLRPDFGVVGGADDFFAHFDDIKNGILDGVANLLFFREGQLISNPRILYSPFEDAEYTPQAIEAMLEFYTSFPSPGFQGAPIEIVRGCNHACVFCAEPHSIGRQVRYRELSSVMKDIEILARHNINRLYMISSELNPEGNEFILQLADTIYTFNTTQAEDQQITWMGANYLLTFDSDEYERLYRSGFTGGWFDITALDDENARAMRTPYRNERLLTHLKTYAASAKKQLELRRTQKALGINTGVRAGDGREDEFVSWSMFLGNPATTIETIRNTIRTANDEGLSNLFDCCGIIRITRVFDYENPTPSVIAATYSVTPGLKRTSYRQILPSFAYPPMLLQSFSEGEVEEMFDHIAETYLSTQYSRTRNWFNFVREKTTAASIANWLTELSKPRRVRSDHPKPEGEGEISTLTRELFMTSLAEDGTRCEFMAKKVVDMLLSVGLNEFSDMFSALGLPETVAHLERITPYELAVSVFKKCRTETELMNSIAGQTNLALNESIIEFIQFCVRAILYMFNVQIKPEYSALLLRLGK